MKIILIGCGAIARKYVKAIEQLPNLEVVACVDPSTSALQEFRKRGYFCTRKLETIADIKADAAMVLTPNHLHYPYSKLLLESGKGVFCEKPLALSMEQAEILWETAEARNCILYPAMHSRFRPEILELKRLEVRDFTHFEHRYLEDWSDAPYWYFDREKAGGGVLIDVGINHIDWLSEILGGLSCSDIRLDKSEEGIDWRAELSYQFQKGKGRVSWSWISSSEDKCTVFNSKSRGEILLDHKNNRLTIDGETIGQWENDEYAATLSDFLATTQNDRAPLERAMDALRNIFELYQRAEEAKPLQEMSA